MVTKPTTFLIFFPQVLHFNNIFLKNATAFINETSPDQLQKVAEKQGGMKEEDKPRCLKYCHY